VYSAECTFSTCLGRASISFFITMGPSNGYQLVFPRGKIEWIMMLTTHLFTSIYLHSMVLRHRDNYYKYRVKYVR
jgi:hypothetical protein